LLQAIPDLVFLLDRNGRFVDFLSARRDTLLTSPDQFIDKSMASLLSPTLASALMDKIRSLTRPGDVVTLQYEMRIGSRLNWFEARLTLCGSLVLALVREVTARHEAEARLRRNEAMLTESQRIAHLGSWEWDLVTNQLFWSEETYRIFGVSPDTFTPTLETFINLVHPDDRARTQSQINDAIFNRTPYSTEHRIRTPDGRVRIIHEQGKVFYDPSGKPFRTLGSALDITERKQAEARLTQANATLERTTAELRRLSRQLTHVEQRERERMALILHDQLQQLLVGTLLNVTALEQGLTDSTLREFAHQAAQTLNKAIQEAKSLTIELSPPILREGGLAEAMKWLGRRTRETHGLDVQVDVESAPAIAYEIGVVLFSAVKELLFNVVKHAGVESARLSLFRSQNGEVRLTVSDDGCGYDKNLAHAREDVSGGFGLFAIRERMESLGGLLEIDSAPGKGFRATLVVRTDTLPETRGGAPAAKPGAAPAPGGSPPARQPDSPTHQKIRILLVDDHTVVRQGLAQLLTRDPGLEIAGEASNGEIALRMTRELLPDVIVMDVNMPVMNGVEATRLIHAEFPHIVVIALSMYEEAHRVEEMRKAGAAAYVSKSEAADALVASIRAACRIGTPS
jgi:PAS domain S-box-containing protein